MYFFFPQSVVHRVVIYSMNIVDRKVYFVYFPTETEQRVLLQAHNRNKSHCGVALYMNSQAFGHNLSCSVP